MLLGEKTNKIHLELNLIKLKKKINTFLCLAEYRWNFFRRFKKKVICNVLPAGLFGIYLDYCETRV